MVVPRLAEHVIEVGAWALNIHRASVPVPTAFGNLPREARIRVLNPMPGWNFLTAMSRRTRREERMLADQDTVGMRRAERKEIEEIIGEKKLARTMTPEERLAKLRDKETGLEAQPRRQPRPGKPLKR